MTTTTLSKEKLFAYLIVDEIHVEEDMLNKARDNDGVSLYKIGQIYYEKKDYAKAIDWFRLGAAKDHATSQFKIGYMYHHGEGVSIDYKLAMEWYQKAHERRAAAKNNIGCLFEHGKGVERDYKIALKWYMDAADKGNNCAMRNVGIYYEHGYGVKIDKQYALEWYEKSAQQGYEQAKDIIKCLNEQSYYLDDKQKRYIQIEKDLAEMESLKKQLELSEQTRLASDNENKVLKQQIETLKLKYYMDSKEQMKLKEGTINELTEAVFKVTIDWVRSNTIKGFKANEENPENDICYD